MREAVIAKLTITASDGKTCWVNQYDLDVIISVCYCVKSLRLRQECSHSRALPAAYYACGGSAHLHKP